MKWVYSTYILRVYTIVTLCNEWVYKTCIKAAKILLFRHISYELTNQPIPQSRVHHEKVSQSASEEVPYPLCNPKTN
jgi:hypothetical protein